MIVYKIESTREELLKIRGSEGSLLNPIYDFNKNLIISREEFESKEFDLTAYKFEEIEYMPVPSFDLLERKLLINSKVKSGEYDKNKEDIERGKIDQEIIEFRKKLYEDPLKNEIEWQK